MLMVPLYVKRILKVVPSFNLLEVIFCLVWLLAGCNVAAPAAVVPTPVIGEPKVSAPVPQQPGEEVGISVDVSSSGGVTLTYDWKADGGDIVRGQGSPAITYRVPTEPGTYNVRVTISWAEHSVERVTSIKVESEGVSSQPTDTPSISTDTPAPPSTQTPIPTDVPKPPTSTPLPAPTNTPRPTNTPHPTPTPTATIDADPTVYDNFNNPAFDGGFNQNLWEHWSDPPYQIAQQDGALVVSHNGKAENGSAVAAHRHIDFTPEKPIFFEAKLQLDQNGQAKGGNVQIHLQAHLPKNEEWFSECGISDDGGAYCFDTIWPWQKEQSYDAQGRSVGYGGWHTVRIELDPTTMTFTYYIDNQMVGSHVPVDAEKLKKARFDFYVGVWSSSTETYNGYIDDVRIGPVEK